jgi:hypothetical protein
MQVKEQYRWIHVDKKFIALGLVVVASGCMHTSSQITPPAQGPGSSGQGLQISTFDISDKALSPGQQGLITLSLENYQDQSIQIDDISLYNTGVLEVEKQGCTPSSSEIDGAREDYIPTVECSWRITAPEEEFENFDSKTIPVKLNLAYNSYISNSKQPVKIHFKPLDEIEQTNNVEESFSNGEVQMDISTESPVQFEGAPVTITVRGAGNGRVDSNYTFEYFPEDVFASCPSEKEPLVEQEAEFSCSIDPQTENSQTRNLVISTSYKYVKAPTLDVEVVNR